MSWIDYLQPASWQGIPFGVNTNEAENGRRTTEHTYPLRDFVEVEDLGRAERRYTFSGFLVGDDVYVRRDLLVLVSERKGPGLLIHPTFGAVQVWLTQKLRTHERWERGRVVEIEFGFTQTPTDLLSFQQTILLHAVIAAAQVLATATSADFSSSTAAPLALGTAVVQQAAATSAAWTAQAVALASDPGLIASAVLALPGNFGRYASGNGAAKAPASATAASLIGGAITARTAVIAAAAAVASAATVDLAGDTTDFAAAVAAVPEALRAAATDPADQVRTLVALSTYTPTGMAGLAPIGQAMATVRTATAALCRRSALTSLALATTDYQPDSYEDAMALRTRVCGLLDAEAITAADAGDDATYQALRALRAQVAQDLIERAADLPHLITVTTVEPQPALALAYRLYQDATRTDDLIARSGAQNPAFLPTNFQALSS